MVTVLAMRPFLPVIPPDEYVEIASICRPYVDVALGEVWYVDKTGILELKVFRGPVPSNVRYEEHEMDFDSNGKTWKVWDGAAPERRVADYCASVNLPFFMRSRPAVLYLRNLLLSRA